MLNEQQVAVPTLQAAVSKEEGTCNGGNCELRLESPNARQSSSLFQYDLVTLWEQLLLKVTGRFALIAGYYSTNFQSRLFVAVSTLP